MARTECSTYIRPVLKGYSPNQEAILLYQPRCKMWVCPYCATINQQNWIIRISDGITHYMNAGIQDWSFVTVTSHPKLKTRSQTLYVWPKAWMKLSRRMRYHFQPFHYVLIPEQHRNARLHIHMIVSAVIATSWLRTNTAKCGLGYMGTAEQISNARGSIFYVTKYLGKSVKETNWPPHLRRVRTSQRWPELEDNREDIDPDIEWIYLTSYPSDGLDYLAEGIRKRTGLDTKILR